MENRYLEAKICMLGALVAIGVLRLLASMYKAVEYICMCTHTRTLTSIFLHVYKWEIVEFPSIPAI